MKDFFDWLDTDGPHQVLAVWSLIITMLILGALAILLCVWRPFIGIPLALGLPWAGLYVWFLLNADDKGDA